MKYQRATSFDSIFYVVSRKFWQKNGELNVFDLNKQLKLGQNKELEIKLLVEQSVKLGEFSQNKFRSPSRSVVNQFH